MPSAALLYQLTISEYRPIRNCMAESLTIFPDALKTECDLPSLLVELSNIHCRLVDHMSGVDFAVLTAKENDRLYTKIAQCRSEIQGIVASLEHVINKTVHAAIAEKTKETDIVRNQHLLLTEFKKGTDALLEMQQEISDTGEPFATREMNTLMNACADDAKTVRSNPLSAHPFITQIDAVDKTLKAIEAGAGKTDDAIEAHSKALQAHHQTIISLLKIVFKHHMSEAIKIHERTFPHAYSDLADDADARAQTVAQYSKATMNEQAALLADADGVRIEQLPRAEQDAYIGKVDADGITKQLSSLSTFGLFKMRLANSKSSDNSEERNTMMSALFSDLAPEVQVIVRDLECALVDIQAAGGSVLALENESAQLRDDIARGKIKLDDFTAKSVVLTRRKQQQSIKMEGLDEKAADLLKALIGRIEPSTLHTLLCEHEYGMAKGGLSVSTIVAPKFKAVRDEHFKATVDVTHRGMTC